MLRLLKLTRMPIPCSIVTEAFSTQAVSFTKSWKLHI